MPISGLAPLVIQFTDTTSGNPTAWRWIFGDGTTSPLQNPVHVYSSTGTYYVTLRATTADGVVEQSDFVIVGSVTAAYTAPAMKGAGAPGDNPQIMLRCSNDGGKTWIFEEWRSAGKQGDFLHRVRWNRLGASRRRVFEVSVIDPVAWRLTGCFLGEPNVAR